MPSETLIGREPNLASVAVDIFHDTYEKVVHGTPWQEDHDVVIPLPHPYHVYAFGAVSNCGVLWEGEQSPATFRAYVKITGWVKDGVAVGHVSENSLEADGIPRSPSLVIQRSTRRRLLRA